MKKSVFVFICAACVVFVFLVPCAAAGSLSVAVVRPYLSIHLVDDPDEPYEEFYVQYSLNNGSFFNLDQFPVSDLDDSGNYLYPIPQSIFDIVQSGANVRYRVAACTAIGCYYSSSVQLQSVVTDDPYISNLRIEGNYLYWDSNVYVYDTVGDRWTVEVTHNGVVTNYYTTNRYFDLSIFFNSLDNLDGDYTFRISAIVRAATIYSNTIEASGMPVYTISVDTDIYYDPSASDVVNAIDLLYSGVKRTPIYKYFYSTALIVISFAGTIFLINKVH